LPAEQGSVERPRGLRVGLPSVHPARHPIRVVVCFIHHLSPSSDGHGVDGADTSPPVDNATASLRRTDTSGGRNSNAYDQLLRAKRTMSRSLPACLSRRQVTGLAVPEPAQSGTCPDVVTRFPVRTSRPTWPVVILPVDDDRQPAHRAWWVRV